MPYAYLDSRNRIVLNGVRQVPEALQLNPRQDGSWSGPPCTDLLERIEATWPGTKVEDDLVIEAAAQRERADRLAAIAERDESPGREDLYPYQTVGVHWLLAAERGILADEQGLGKTVQALVAAEEAGATRVVTVSGRANAPDWQEHAEEWTGFPTTLMGQSEDDRLDAIAEWRKRAGVLSVNYWQAAEHRHELSEADTLILDEAHNLRNPDTDRFRGLVTIADSVARLYCCTASPVMNSPEDLWALLRLIDGERFSSFWSFVFRFCHVNKHQHGIDIVGLNPKERPALERLLRGYVIRRTNELLDLPTRHRAVTEWSLTGEHESLYRQMETTGACSYGGQTVETWEAVQRITRLRQLLVHPGLLFDDYEGPSRLDALEELSFPVPAILFTTFAGLCDMAVDRWMWDTLSVDKLHGSMTTKQIRDVLRRTRRGEVDWLFVTHGTGGEGLNVPNACSVVFLDLAWVPESNRHAEARIYRPGQRANEVFTHILRTPGTIDDHVWALLHDKERVTIDRIMRRMQSDADAGEAR